MCPQTFRRHGPDVNAMQPSAPYIRRADDPNPPLSNDVRQLAIFCQQIVCRPKFEIEGWGLGIGVLGVGNICGANHGIATSHTPSTQQLHGEQSSTRHCWWVKSECIQLPTRGVGSKRQEASPKTTVFEEKGSPENCTLTDLPSLMTACRPMLPMRGQTDLCPCGSCGETTSPSTLLCLTRAVAPLPASVSARFRF